MGNLKSFADNRTFKLYIDDLLHFEICLENCVGVQSWIEDAHGDNPRFYVVEFYLKQGPPILLEYVEIDLWKSVLKAIDENLKFSEI